MKRGIQSTGLFGRNEDLLTSVHAHSLDVIEGTGIRFPSEKAREILHAAGAEISGEMVKIPGNVIESALEKAPATFTLCAREPSHDLEIDGKHTYYSQDGCAAFTLDFETGERRSSCLDDVAKMARIADALEPVNVITPTVSAQDAPPTAVPVCALQACFANTGKHVITEDVASARDAQSEIELAAAIVGGKEKLRERPVFSNFVCTISPLTQDPGGIEAALEFAQAGVPVGMYSMATSGMTAPVTQAGTLVVLNAEVVSALALLQIAVPEAKVFYAGGPATMDLRKGAYTGSSPEALWLRMMVAEMGRFYGIPTIAGAGATSAKLPGPQAAWENAVSLLLPTLAGASLLFGLGLLDGSNLLTYEELVLDAEAGAMVRRIASEVGFDEDDFAVDMIKEMGADGAYLRQSHTRNKMRQALSVPALSDRDGYEEWFSAGGRSRVAVARDRVSQILTEHEPPPLPESVKQEMEEVVARYSG
jgi:trimethylamine--corrinoid protein Co-methyltransferase